jgi:hypothetical protein
MVFLSSCCVTVGFEGCAAPMQPICAARSSGIPLELASTMPCLDRSPGQLGHFESAEPRNQISRSVNSHFSRPLADRIFPLVGDNLGEPCSSEEAG